jgi:hypothetical protein
MIGLEKTKAKAGEVSQSARALSLEDMHRLYDACFDPKLTDAQKRWGAIRYVSPCCSCSAGPSQVNSTVCLPLGILDDPSH